MNKETLKGIKSHIHPQKVRFPKAVLGGSQEVSWENRSCPIAPASCEFWNINQSGLGKKNIIHRLLEQGYHTFLQHAAEVEKKQNVSENNKVVLKTRLCQVWPDIFLQGTGQCDTIWQCSSAPPHQIKQVSREPYFNALCVFTASPYDAKHFSCVTGIYCPQVLDSQ